jgi:hypothetical protein
MNVHFPTARAIRQDADIIIASLNERTKEIKKNVDSQGVIKKIVLRASKILGLASGVMAVAAVTASLLTFSVTPLMIAMAATALAITCFGISILQDPRNASESLIKDQWKALLESLRQDLGEDIIKRGHDLLKQKEQHAAAYAQCIGKLDPEALTPFFHKTCVVGYLLIALESLHQKEEEKAKSNAHLALSHFDSSSFPPEIEQLALWMTNNPKELISLIEKHHVGHGVPALDYLIFLKTKTETRPQLHPCP